MTRFLATGDWHGDAYTAGVRRFDDVKNAANATAQAARQRSVDYYLFLGDLADPDVGAFWSNQLAIGVKQSLPIECKSFWLVGNHDVVEDGYGTHSMLPLSACATVISEPMAIELRQAISGAAHRPSLWLLCFPYTSTARAYSPVDQAKAFCEKVPKDAQVVIISHLMLEGISAGSETSDMARGRDVFLPVELLTALFPGCTIFNGHYHTAQTFKDVVHLPGSLIRLTKSEVGNVPGYIIADVP